MSSNLLDRNGDRAVLDQSSLHVLDTVLSHVDPAGQFHGLLHVVRMAFAVHAQIATIVLLQSQTTGVHRVLVDTEVLSARAAVVAEWPTTVDQLLLGQSYEVAVLGEVVAFNRTVRTWKSIGQEN